MVLLYLCDLLGYVVVFMYVAVYHTRTHTIKVGDNPTVGGFLADNLYSFYFPKIEEA